MIISKTPLRISLLGGNTDYPKYFKKYGGACLTTTIDKYVYCIVKERFDNAIWINYSDKEKVNNIKDIKHDLTREALKLLNINKSIEITFLSDIPSEGSGLGSSSALLIGLLNALHIYKNEQVTKEQLAEEACKIEIDILKKPIGYQDQYAIAYGGFNLIEFGKKIKVKPVNYYTIKDNLLLYYTYKTRKSEDILKKMSLNKKILDKNKKLAYLGSYSLSDEIIFGDLINKYWNLKIKLNKQTTNKYLDKMHRYAIKNEAIGAKIVGAGGGGFMLLVVSRDKMDHLKFYMESLFKELPFNIEPNGSRIVFNS